MLIIPFESALLPVCSLCGYPRLSIIFTLITPFSQSALSEIFSFHVVVSNLFISIFIFTSLPPSGKRQCGSHTQRALNSHTPTLLGQGGLDGEESKTLRQGL